MGESALGRAGRKEGHPEKVTFKWDLKDEKDRV